LTQIKDRSSRRVTCATARSGLLGLAIPATPRRSNATGIVRAGVDRPIHTRPPCTSSDVAIEDLDDLFRAVTTRLALAFDTPPAATQWVGLKIGVLDRVQALEQSRTTMTHELDRVRQGRAERQAI